MFNMSKRISARLLGLVQLQTLVRFLIVSMTLFGICGGSEGSLDLTMDRYKLLATVGAADLFPREESTELQSLQTIGLKGNLSFSRVEWAGEDFGLQLFANPAAVLYAAVDSDIASVVSAVYNSDSCKDVTIAARGQGHSIRGQAQALQGIVVDMSSITSEIIVNRAEMYVETGAGELWVDVLRACLQVGLTPKSFTDYLRLSVGGTLSNAGISGQAFRWGPEISNVLLLQVIKGTGESVTCTRDINSDLFFAALGGLGQFGIITRARIALQPAPSQVKWIRVLYSDFSQFKADQELLISQAGNADAFDYVEGFVISNTPNPVNGYSSIPFPGSNQAVNPDLLPSPNSQTTLYSIELALNYDNDTVPSVIEEKLQTMLGSLKFIPTQVFVTDVSYFNFLDRVYEVEKLLRSRGQWEVPHPWLNLFVPGSKILEFHHNVFEPLTPDIINSGPIIAYALNKTKWDPRMSAQIPDEDVFYLVAFLPSVLQNESPSLMTFVTRNSNISAYNTGLGGKEYLPHYSTLSDWKTHFGSNWDQFLKNKLKFDPAGILAPGQKIFQRGRVS